MREFENNFDFWIKGPNFLATNEWPKGDLSSLPEDFEQNISSNFNVLSNNVDLLNIEKFSKFHRVINVVGYILKFRDLLMKKNTVNFPYYEHAKLFLIKSEQRKYFGEEIKFLCNSNEVENIPSRVNNLNLFLCNNGILRCGGRLGETSLAYELKNPIILHRKSHLTKLLISERHEACHHLGTNITLSKVRTAGFWIPKGRSCVKEVVRNCMICKKFNVRPFQYPKPTDFISDKINFKTPFKFTGIDFTGHFFVKFGHNVVKMYLLLFTCLNVRAIHLELVPNMSCTEFLNAFTRFSSIFGLPTKVFSDNANTFIQAISIISKGKISNDFVDFFERNEIKHVRIPLYAAFMGAAWERMIRTVKSCLSKVIGRKQINYFQFITLLADVQNSVNSRPLTYINNDENMRFITPNDFLKPNAGRTVLLGGSIGSDIEVAGRAQLVAGLQKREQLLDDFKTRWYEEYLMSLREASRDVYQQDFEQCLKPGDIVLVHSPVKPRAMWQMGRVVAVHSGTGRQARSATVMRPDRTEGKYPVNLLYPLEMSVGFQEEKSTGTSTYNEPQNDRPKRKEAQKCLERIKKCD